MVFSTSVEVFLCIFRPISSLSRLLHVRGGVSAQQLSTSAWGKSSPRPWRCFHVHSLVYIAKFVFSTSVEVFLVVREPVERFLRLLHVRGGVSERLCNDHDSRQSSPRPWRCFRVTVQMELRSSGLLHVRGGVSRHSRSGDFNFWSSPRPWRCFPTAIEGP